MGYRPCLDFSEKYSKESSEIVKDMTKYLMVVVSGWMNQQRNQIVDVVVIARILGAALVVPILQNGLANDVRIVWSLPSAHLMASEKRTPLHASLEWIRSRYLKRLSTVRNGEKDGKNYENSEFWKQPDGMGYRPCLDFSEKYSKESDEIVKDKTKYLMVVVSGGMNQQRNQTIDAVVIARILGAALVVPILQVNVIWGDERRKASQSLDESSKKDFNA
ncbi:unnamed protein product [Fraxinus pennsylvanica]|uniref:O-fucosyltransferase family protein n=1 Tax=Fraxinus pennsylvanica TaxID=56036 RepID=A0AAD2A7Q0_9LAMI|nr:unnamed protein product [Fraxinus pennsylvanica]